MATDGQIDTPATDDRADTEADRRCVACGYSLRGLGEEPRCPECGLLHTPAGFRQQVLDLVDAGAWFFSPVLRPFRKRPPGWWWALDRDGDVKRSFRFLICYIAATVLPILLLGSLAGSVVVEVTETATLTYRNNPSASPTLLYEQVKILGASGKVLHFEQEPDTAGQMAAFRRAEAKATTQPASGPTTPFGGLGFTLTKRTARRTLFQPSFHALAYSAMFALLLLLIWAIPAVVGLWTQIRPGLGESVQARRTVVAASNYEAHRLVYNGVLACAALCLDTVARVAHYAGLVSFYRPMPMVLFLIVFLFAIHGWYGPLESDRTRRLIRSQKHQVRILLMYAAIFPLILAGMFYNLFD